MQVLCQNLFFTFFYDKLRFIKGLLLCCCLVFSFLGYAQTSQMRTFMSGSTVDSVRVASVTHGGMFLEIRSYFEEYSATKPGSITQFYWINQQKNGDLNVRYVFDNTLVDFHVETSMQYENNSKQVLELNLGRRLPLLLQIMLVVRDEKLYVELL